MRTHHLPRSPSDAEPPALLSPGPAASPLDAAPANGEVSERDPAGMNAETVEASRARGIMKTVALLVASAFVGGLVGALVIFLVLGDVIGSRGGSAVDIGEPARVAPTPSEGVAGKAGALLPVEGTEWAAVVDDAGRLIAAGKLREAQDLYLTVLLVEPGHQAAMKGLVRVRRLMADGDPAALLRQADAFRRAIAQGVETDEHYTAPAMELLARASQQAASELRGTARAEARPAPRPAPRVESSAPTAKPQPPSPRAKSPATKPAPPPRAPAPAPKPAPSKPPAQTTPAPSPPPAQTTPAPAVPLNVNEPFYTVTVGPFATGDRASAITAELTVAGYAARVRRQGPGSYIITLGPYRQSVAERAAAFLRSRFGQDLPVAMTRTP